MDDYSHKHRTREISSRHHHKIVPTEEKSSHKTHHGRYEGTREPVPRILREAQYPFAGQKDYVQRWLAQTADDPLANTSNQSIKHRNTEITQSNKTPAERPKFPQFLLTKDHDSRQREMESDEKHYHKKHSLEFSSESSFLERGHGPQLNYDKNHRELDTKEDDIYEQEKVFHYQRRHKRKHSSSPAIEVSPTHDNKPIEIFERRTRHKAKEDKYEPKKRREKENKEGKSKRAKKSEFSKLSNVPGSTLMKNFESKNVENDRLTIRPSHKLGLFNHGRASSPGRHRGLPDLAFSEMEFLQRSNRETNHQSKRPPPKNRKKERRREDRVFNEISAYFNAGKEPLAEIDNNRHDLQKSKARELEYEQPRVRQTTISSHGSSLQRQTSMHDIPDFEERPFLGVGRQASILTKHRNFAAETPRRGSTERPTNSTSRISRPATSYVSWSESLASPHNGVKPRHARDYSGHEKSSTPESIRRAITQTRVFGDTGLQRNISFPAGQDIKARLRELQQDAEGSSLSRGQPPNRIRSPQDLEDLRKSPDYVDSVSDASAADEPQNAPRNNRPTDFDLSRFRADVPRPTIKVPREFPKHLQRSKEPPVVLEVRHYDPHVGWHQSKVDEEQASIRHSIENPGYSISVRPNKSELAQAAYIRPRSKNTLQGAETGKDKKRTPSGLPVLEVAKMNRPATAPPNTTSFPVIPQPCSTAAASTTVIPNDERVLHKDLAAMENPNQVNNEVDHNRGLSQNIYSQQRNEINSLPPLTDRVSASSATRTESVLTTQPIQAFEGMHGTRNQVPEKLSVEHGAHFGLPIRGSSSTRQLLNPPPIRIVSPVITTDSLYGQQLERGYMNNFQNETWSHNLNDDLLQNGRKDLNFAQEEAFIQGLSHQMQDAHEMLSYPESGNIQLEYEIDRSGNFADIEKLDEDQIYGDREAEFEGNFVAQQSEVDKRLVEEEHNKGVFEEKWNEREREYLGENLFRREEIMKRDGDMILDDSLAEFWKPYRQY